MHSQVLASSLNELKESISEPAIKKRSVSPVQDLTSVGTNHQEDFSSYSSLAVVARQSRHQQ